MDPIHGLHKDHDVVLQSKRLKTPELDTNTKNYADNLALSHCTGNMGTVRFRGLCSNKKKKILQVPVTNDGVFAIDDNKRRFKLLQTCKSPGIKEYSVTNLRAQLENTGVHCAKAAGKNTLAIQGSLIIFVRTKYNNPESDHTKPWKCHLSFVHNKEPASPHSA